jgi:hypothetical protein
MERGRTFPERLHQLGQRDAPWGEDGEVPVER